MHFIGTVQLGLAALVLHRIGRFPSPIGAKLDEIGDASQIEAPARQRQCHHPADGATFPIGGVMRNIMQDPSLGREAVLLPLPLDMDQCGLTQAIDRMLERG